MCQEKYVDMYDRRSLGGGEWSDIGNVDLMRADSGIGVWSH